MFFRCLCIVIVRAWHAGILDGRCGCHIWAGIKPLGPFKEQELGNTNPQLIIVEGTYFINVTEFEVSVAIHSDEVTEVSIWSILQEGRDLRH